MWNPLEVKDLITSADELKSLVGEPHEAVVKKSIAQVESHVIHYVSMSPLFFLSTADASGRCDVSPRGDEPGFVKVLDDHHIIFPERMGNRRVDSLLNIIANPQVGIFQVWKKCCVLTDQLALQKMQSYSPRKNGRVKQAASE